MLQGSATRILFFVASASLGAALAVTACGGSSTGTAADSGAGTDAALEAAAPIERDASSDAKADVPCTAPGIDEQKVPDASLDDGGITTAACVACLKAKCSDEIKTCNGDCDCRTAANTFFACLNNATDFQKVIACASTAGFNLPKDSQDKLYAVGLCANSDCNKECVPSGIFDGGLDAKGDF